MIIKMKFIYTNAPDKAEFSAYGQKFAMSNVYIYHAKKSFAYTPITPTVGFKGTLWF